MNYKEVLNSITDVPKSLIELLNYGQFLIEFEDGKVLELYIEDIRYYSMAEFNSIQEYSNEVLLEESIVDIFNVEVSEDIDRNLRKLIPNIKNIYYAYI